MLPFRCIVCAADFSESSRDAFRVACALANEDKTRVFVVFVAEEPMVLGEIGTPIGILEPTPGTQQEIRQRLRDFYVPDHPVDVEYRSVQGAPAEQILSMADELDCDLIVMGTHGRTGLSRLLAGSVAETVIRKSHRPVLALRCPKHLGAPKHAASAILF
jgi:nucleotide-binding universal stress UspA family protein